MSTKTITVCDICANETLNMSASCWIQLEKLSLWHGLGNPEKGARISIKEQTYDANKHFCSMACFNMWLQQQMKCNEDLSKKL